MSLVFQYKEVAKGLRPHIKAAVQQLPEAATAKTVTVRRIQHEAAAIIGEERCDDVIVVNFYDEEKHNLKKLRCPTAHFQH